MSKLEDDENNRHADEHQRRLQRVIKCNGMTTLEVPSDGNCFFNSLSILLHSQIGMNIDSVDLREKAYREIIDHYDEYKEFLFDLHLNFMMHLIEEK